MSTAPKTLEFQVTVEVTFEFLEDALINIVEGGGSDYWAVIKHWRLGKDGVMSWGLVRSIDERSEDYRTMDHDLILLGLGRVLRQEVKVAPAHLTSIRSAVLNNDGGYMDADDLDCVLQAAAFNEITYC